jgi:type 1 fimbriae regulatory protein FimB/type 1 fimbriae regulatory protein FimE
MGRLIRFIQEPKMVMLPPKRVPNSERRSREYLSPAEVDSMITAAKNAGRHGHRDGTLILLSYRHAARVSEVIAWRRDQVDLEQGLLHVNRLKNGTPSVHPLRGPEIRALRKLFRDYPNSPYVFSTERGGPMTTATARKIVARAGELAEVGFPVHPHMLRHATGYYLASKGQDTRAIQAYMGHKNIQHTVRYTELSPERFKDFWKD